MRPCSRSSCCARVSPLLSGELSRRCVDISAYVCAVQCSAVVIVGYSMYAYVCVCVYVFCKIRGMHSAYFADLQGLEESFHEQLASKEQ
jgi:hypothetical protein